VSVPDDDNRSHPTPLGDAGFMALAMEEARIAGREGEVPVGAVVVAGGRVVGLGHNRSIPDHDPSAHAEIVALRAAAATLGNHRLTGATLYVTLEPCIMCAGAILHARIERLVYAAPDPRFGAAGSALNLLDSPFLNHRSRVTAGVLRDQAAELLEGFFADRRD
jgi:tRNA(adenine34) deaminase